MTVAVMVALASPRNDGGSSGTQLRILATPCVRVVAYVVPPIAEGAGNAGRALHPRSHAQRERKGAPEHTGSAEAPGIPCVMA
jgi:hypothetical protein